MNPDTAFPDFRRALIGMGGVSPMSGPSNGMGMSELNSSGGMDAMGTLRAHQKYGTRFTSDPTGMGSNFFSTGGMNYGG